MTTVRHHSTATAVLGLVLLLGSASAVTAQTGEITGTVYDESNSSTVGDLWVELYQEDGNHIASTLTNTGSGVYAFTGLADGVYFVRATSDPAPGRDLVGEWYQDANEYDFDLAARLEISSSNTLSGIDFQLARGSSISGQLFGLGGGEDIDLSVYDATSWRHRGGVRSNLGSYNIDSLPPSSYKLFADPYGTDRAFQWWDGRLTYNEADTILVGEDVDIAGKDFTLTEGTSISGTVTLDPIPGDPSAVLQQIWIEAFESATHEHLYSANVATDGTYGFTNLPPGSYLTRAQTHSTDYVQEMWVTGADDPLQEPVFHMHEGEPIAVDVETPATGIDFLLEEGRRISGNVYLDGVGVVQHASISADEVSGGYGRGSGTDSSGDYTFSGLAPGQYHVRAESGLVDEPFTAQVWQDKNLYEDPDPVDVSSGDATLVDFVVSQERTVSGKVFLDSNNDQVQQTGESGFSNLTIRAFDFATDRWLGHAAIAPDGLYSIGVPAGVYKIEASPHHPGLLREAWENGYFGDDATPVDVQTADATWIDFGIVAGEYFGTLRGTVIVDGSTDGISGVDVQVWRYDNDQHILSGQTDADGYFTVENLPPGSYKVLFNTGGRNATNDTDYVSSFWSSTGVAGDPDPDNHRIDYPTVTGDGTDLGEFELTTGGSISGTVYPPSGDSLPLPFNVDAEYFISGGPPLAGATVEIDGTYHLRGLPEGPFRVRASTWGTGFVSVYYLTSTESTWDQNGAAAAEVVQGVETGGIDLHLLSGGSISGEVTLASTGDPLPGIQLNVNLMDDPQGRGYWDSVGTDVDGTYILQGLPTGDYRVRTDDRSGNYANQIYPTLVTVVEPAETTDIDFALTAPATLSGRVYWDVNGNGAYDAVEERAGVLIQAQDWSTGAWMSDAVSGSDGLYEIPGLGVGTYQIWLEPNETNFVRMGWDNSFDQPTPVEITEVDGLPQDVGTIDFRVVQGFEIRGFVFWDADNDGVHDAGESPVNNAWINADSFVVPYNAWGGTSPDGTYTIHGVHPGRYLVHAGAQNLIEEYWQDAYYSDDATEMNLTSGAAAGIDFSLVAGEYFGTLRGRVIGDSSPGGIPDVHIMVRRFEDDNHIRSEETDANGYYTFENLPPGSYRVLFGTRSTNAANDTDFIPSFWSSTGVAGDPEPANHRFDYPGDLGDGTDLGAFELVTGGSISGTVHPPSGDALPLPFSVDAEYFFGGTLPLPSFAVEGDGSYHLRGLPVGFYRIHASTWGTGFVSVYYLTPSESTWDQNGAGAVEIQQTVETTGIDLHLLRGGSISGLVTLAGTSDPLPGIQINLNLVDDPQGRGYGDSAHTAANGTYILQGLPTGDYRVRTDDRSGNYGNQIYPSNVTVTEPLETSGVDFELTAPATISGRVYEDTDSSGTYNPGEERAGVFILAQDWTTNEWLSNTVSGTDGLYEIGSLGVGTYQMWLEPNETNFVRMGWDNSFDSPTPVVITEVDGVPQDVGGIDFRVVQGFEIRGFVFWDADNDGIHDAGESPVSNAWVNVQAVSGPYNAWGGTNSDGTYTIHGVHPGSYHVQSGAQNLIEEYWLDAYYSEDATEIDVTSGTATGIDFSLVAGQIFGTLRGRVVTVIEETSTGIPGVDVQLRFFEDDQGIASATTGEFGHFEFHTLAPSPAAGYKVYFETSWTNDQNLTNHVASYWAAEGEPGVIDPNDMRVVFPTLTDPPTPPGTDLGEFELATGGSISGRVRAPGGGPLPEGIGVSAHSFESGGQGLPGATVDELGYYHFRGIPAPATFRVQADAWHTDLVSMYYWTYTESTFDHWTATAVQVEADTDTDLIDIHLIQGGSISGEVTMKSDGTSVPDFPVSAGMMNDPFGRWYSQGVSTNVDGTYRVNGLPDGEYEVRTDAREGALANETYPGAVPVVAPGDTPGIDFELEAAGRITGWVTQVVGGNVEPVVNIRVEATEYVDGQFWSDGYTDANGYYSIGALTQGYDYRVQVQPWNSPDPQSFNFIAEYWDDELFWETALPVTLPVHPSGGISEVIGIDFEITFGGAISGIVTSGDDPLQNVSVSANLFSGASDGNGANTDHNGFYIIRGLPEDTYRVHASAWPQPYVDEYFDDTTDWSLATVVSVLAVPPGGPIPVTDNIDFDLGPAYSISGSVTDANDDAIPNIQVTASGLDVSSWSQGTTNGDGDYVIHSLEPGTYEVAAEPWGTDYIRQQQEVDLTVGDAGGVDFTLQIGAVMSGRVYVDSDENDSYDPDEESEGVWISVSDFYTGQYFGSGMSDADGLYEVRGLGVGSYMLWLDHGEHNLVQMAWPNDTGEGGAQPVIVAESGSGPEDVPGIDFQAIQGFEIRGIVFFDANDDGDQWPEEPGIPNISINAEFQGGFWVHHVWTGSDTDGAYTLHGVYPGPHTVSAHAGDTPYASELFKLVDGYPVGTFNVSEADHIDVSSGDVTGIDLSLELGGGIAGTVTDSSTEEGLGSIDLWVNRLDGDGLWWGATTDSNGNYLVNGLSPDEYVIQAWDHQEIYVSEFHEDAVFWEDASSVWVSARQSVTDPLATEVNFELDVGGAIEGVVYHDANGNGVQDAGEPGLEGVGIHLEEFADPRRYIMGGSTDSNGDFRVGGLPPGLDMRVSVDTWGTDFLGGFYDGGDDSPTTDSEQAIRVSVTAGGTTTGIDFGLGEGGSITGVVVDGDGNPIPGIHVNANSPEWGTGDNTDNQGQYILRGLFPGDYQVSTGGDPYRYEWYDNQTEWQAHTPVNVQAGVTTGGIDFVLPVMPRITGGPTPAEGERGRTVTGVTVTAEQLTAGATIELGDGLTITNLVLDSGTFSFNVTIATDAPLGGRSLSVVNDQALEDGADTLANAFEVLRDDNPAPSTKRLYVTDFGRSQVRVYGTADNSLLGILDLCCNPYGIVLSPDGSFAYVNGDDGRLSVIDTRLGDVGEEVAQFYLFGNFGNDAMAATNSHVYAIDRSSGLDQIWVLDTATWEVESTIALDETPFGLGIDPVGQKMYVAHNYSDSVSVIDLDPASATFHEPLTTVTLPGGSRPRAVDFTSDGTRAYVAGNRDTYVIHTGLALTNPDNAVVAHLSRLGAPIDIVQHTASGKELAFLEMGGLVAVVDVTPTLPEPQILLSLTAGFSVSGIRATADQLFLAHSGSFDVWVVDTEELLSSAALSLTRFDGPEPAHGLGYLLGGLAVGASPAGPPAGGPLITDVGGPVENGSPFSLTISGSNFDPDAVVWLQGTPDRGTVTSATLSELVVDFVATTPVGDHHVVVTNPVSGGGASAVSDTPVEVRPPASFAPTQTLYVSSYGAAQVEVFNTDGTTATIPTLPFAAGMAITPDGDLGFVAQFHDGPWSSWEDLPEHFYDMAVVDLDTESPTYLEAIAQIPWIWTSFWSPVVTPNLDDPNGIFVYAPNHSQSDTVSVIDPATLAEVDIDNDPNTSSLPRNFPYDWISNGDAMPGINRIELDGDVTDQSLRPNDVALTPDGTLLYVANWFGSLSIVDTVTRKVEGELTANGNLTQARDVVITPTDSGTGVFVYLYGNDGAGDTFLFIFEAGNTNDATALVYQIPLPRYGRAMTISQDGKTVYVAANIGYPDLRSEVYVIDVRPSSRSITDVIDLPDRVYKLIEAPDDRLLYLSAVWQSVIFVVDVAPGSGYPLITTLNASACPLDVAVEPSAGAVHPVVTSVTPNSGSPAGGDPVVITGANFAAGATVEFGNENFATSVEVEGNYAIEAVTPASSLPGNGTGSVHVTVRNSDDRSDRLANGFTYKLDTVPPVFTTPPYVASQVLVGDPPSEATVEIRWQTIEASDSLVDYREVGQSVFLQQSDPVLTTDHLITLTGLNPATDYEFRATSADAHGNSAISPAPDAEPNTKPFTTPTAPDVVAPVITGPTAAPDINSAVIQWDTNEEATTVVQYDADIDGNFTRQAFGSSGTHHSVMLTGLVANTEHEYRVLSVDASGNIASADETFTTDALPDTTPPVIIRGPEPTYLANDLVIVQWQTDEPSTSFVNYGTSSILEQGVVDLDLVTNHVVFLTNLLPGTAYGYQVGSTDPNGNTVLSADPFAKTLQTLGTSRLTGDLKVGVVTLKAGAYITKAEATDGFTTPKDPDTTAPVSLSVTVTPLSFDRVLVTVETDEDTSLLARYGVGGLTDSVFDPAFNQVSSVLLAGLAPSTTFDLSVELVDPKGNATTVDGLYFTTPAEPDDDPPVISALTVDPVTETTALVRWTTDEPTDATVRFGAQGGALDRQVGRLGLATTHEILITGLTPATTYDAEVASRDASVNVGTLPTAFTTTAAAPVITSVTPSSAVLGASVEVAVNGTHFDGASADLGAGVTIAGVTVNDSGTQVRVEITVAPSAAVGPRQIVITTGYGSAAADFTIVDDTVPVVEILLPLNDAELTSLTVAVHGNVSELAEVTVNGVVAVVTNGNPITFDATVTLPGAGLRGISATAVDPSGNRGTHTITVTVTNQPPVALCRDVTVSADGSCQAAMTPALVDGGSYDPDGNSLGMTVDPAVLSGLGSHAVTLTVDDGEIQDSCSSTVTVVDTTAPTIDAISANPSVLWPPNHKMTKVTVDFLSSNACDVEPLCRITGVASNEPESACDKKDEEPDWEITGDLSVKLRAERCGDGDGRIYTITVTCADAAGNTADATTVVTVPHDQGD